MAKTKEKNAAKKSSKSKTRTHEVVLAELNAAKEAKKTARGQFTGFCLKEKCSQKEAPKDKKVKAEWTKLHDDYKAHKAIVEKLEEEEKSLRPKKERAVKYEYPADCTSAADKKKYRAKMRAAAKGEDKAAKKAKSSKGEKKDKAGKKDKTQKGEKKDKTGKKAKKSSD